MKKRMTLVSFFKEDQSERLRLFGTGPRPKQPPAKAYRALKIHDQQRRAAITTLIRTKKPSKRDWYYAAMVYQHGTKPQDYHRAHNYATRSMKLGYKPARWLYAASLDRYLMSLKKPQRYGTQYILSRNNLWKPYRIDPSTSDSMRIRYDVPPLKMILKKADNMNK